MIFFMQRIAKATALAVKDNLLVVLMFGLLTLVVTLPLITDFLTRIPGYGDALTYLWTLWWFHHALVVLHQNPFFTNFQFYPEVINISQDVSMVHGVLALPIISWLGPYAGYNSIIFFTYVVTGAGFYLFLRSLITNKIASFFGSSFFTFSYYRNIRITEGHVDIAATEWYGFVLYYLTALFYHGKNTGKNIVGSALFLALCAYTEYRNFFYITLFFGTYALMSSLILVVTSKKNEAASFLMQQAQAFVSVSLIVWFLLVPLFALNLDKIGDVQFAPTYPSFNAHAPAFILPPCNTWLGKLLPRCFSSPVYEGGMVFLGIVPILFSLSYLVWRNGKRDWTIIALFGSLTVIFLWLSLGTTTPLYTWLFEHIPLFKVVRVPSRLVVLAGACLSVIGAFGVQAMFQRAGMVIRFILIGFTALFLIAEGTISDVKYVRDQTESLRHLAVLEEGHSYSLLEVPFGFRGNIYETLGSHNTGQSFYYQLKHKIPLIGGYMSMINFDTWKNIRDESMLIKLINCQESSTCEPLSDEERKVFNGKYKIKYVSFLSDKYEHFEQYLKRNFPLKELYRDGKVTVLQNLSFSSD